MYSLLFAMRRLLIGAQRLCAIDTEEQTPKQSVQNYSSRLKTLLRHRYTLRMTLHLNPRLIPFIARLLSIPCALSQLPHQLPQVTDLKHLSSPISQ